MSIAKKSYLSIGNHKIGMDKLNSIFKGIQCFFVKISLLLSDRLQLKV
jgi:hypothetical protein